MGMSLESDLFLRMRPDADKLLQYGFKKHNNQYIYTCDLNKDAMHAKVTVDKDGLVSGNVIDEETGDVYAALHRSGQLGNYASDIRQRYLDVLEDIASRCFHKVPYIFNQTNRIDQKIQETYGDSVYHPFEKYPYYGAYRPLHSDKWYALVMDIQREKIDAGKGICEIMNLKSDRVSDLIKKEGIYPAWHMNHNNWITVVMDDTYSDEEIMDLIDISRNLVNDRIDSALEEHSWIIPANPRYFDLDHAFSLKDDLYWGQTFHVKNGDLIYIYYGMPFGEIRYLCKVTETDIPVMDHSMSRHTKMMRIHKLLKYEDGMFNRKLLKKYGVTNVRGARHMPSALEKEIKRVSGGSYE